MNGADRKRFEEILYRMQKINAFLDGVDEESFIRSELLKMPAMQI